jgi:hypothetical protein
VPRTGIQVVNQFHPLEAPLQVDAVRPERLLVPTAKGLSEPVPLPGLNGVDHYKCYMAKPSKGTPKSLSLPIVGIEDQFMCYQARAVGGLCGLDAPINKGGVCSAERECGGTRQTGFCELQAKFQRVVGLFVNNQFGPSQLDATKEEELCVPSTMP